MTTDPTDAGVCSLRKAIDYWIKYLDQRRRRNKLMATIMRLAIIALSAAITISLAIDLSEKFTTIPSHHLKLFAIVCSAVGVSVASFETFIDHKKMWITNGISLSSMVLLRQKIDFLASQNQVSTSDLESLFEKMSEIATSDAKNWEDGRLRSPDLLKQPQFEMAPSRKAT